MVVNGLTVLELPVVLLATGIAWYSGRQWVHEKYFDYLVAQQKADLRLGSMELAGEIANRHIAIRLRRLLDQDVAAENVGNARHRRGWRT